MSIGSASGQKHSSKQTPRFQPKRRGQTEPGRSNGKHAGDAQKDKDDDEDLGPWKGLQYRFGRSVRGGRVVAVAGAVGQDTSIILAQCRRRVETTDGGLNWKPNFRQGEDASPAIGAIAVSESDPNVIYVGTGEACIRGNIVGGNGVY